MFNTIISFTRLGKNIRIFLAVASIFSSAILFVSQISCKTVYTNSEADNPGVSVPGPSAEEEGGGGEYSQTSSFSGQLIQLPILPPAEPLPEWAPDGVISNSEYSDSAKFGDITIFWRTYYEYFYAAIKIPANGWGAFAIQPKTGASFENADIILGFVNNGQGSVYDMFSSNANGPFLKDTDLGGTSNIFDFGVRQEGGFTTIEFKRALSTGDKYDKNFSFPLTNITLAYGEGNRIPDEAMLKIAYQNSVKLPVFYFEPPEHVC
jgi:hypothetical protein